MDLAAPTGRVLGLQDIAPYADYSAALDHVGVVGTFVDLAQRRQGIGRRLAQATFAAARDAGYEKLFASIRADNPAAQRYYGSLGFTTIGIARRQARFRQGDGWRYVDEILVELWL
mgnify:FL=1